MTKPEGVALNSPEGHDFDSIAELTEITTISFVTKRMTDAYEAKVCLTGLYL